MPKTFHYFLQLPWELRNEIWQLATRPYWPGAHVFSVYDIEWDEDADRSMDMIFDRPIRWGHNGIRLSAPKSLPKPNEISVNHQQREQSLASWTCNNTSMYLLDGGLWTACKESRKVMEKEHSEKDRKSRRAVATSYFVGHDSANHYFTVMPHRDLFILQPFEIENLELEDIDKYIPIGSAYAGFRSIRHFGLEYEPAWGELAQGEFMGEVSRRDLRELPIVQFLLQSARECLHVSTIWIIDYGLQRSRGGPEDDDYHQEFFYQQDRRYFRPTCSDLEWNTKSWRFVKEVEEEICEMLEKEDGRSFANGRPYGPYVRLLGCQYF